MKQSRDMSRSQFLNALHRRGWWVSAGGYVPLAAILWRRTKPAVLARQHAWSLLRGRGWSFPEIAFSWRARTGGTCSHTTVMAAVKRNAARDLPGGREPRPAEIAWIRRSSPR